MFLLDKKKGGEYTYEMNICRHESIGRGMIEHDGMSHPGGEQFCFDCKKTVPEILKECYNEGVQDSVKEIERIETLYRKAQFGLDDEILRHLQTAVKKLVQ